MVIWRTGLSTASARSHVASVWGLGVAGIDESERAAHYYIHYSYGVINNHLHRLMIKGHLLIHWLSLKGHTAVRSPQSAVCCWLAVTVVVELQAGAAGAPVASRTAAMHCSRKGVLIRTRDSHGGRGFSRERQRPIAEDDRTHPPWKTVSAGAAEPIGSSAWEVNSDGADGGVLSAPSPFPLVLLLLLPPLLLLLACCQRL